MCIGGEGPNERKNNGTPGSLTRVFSLGKSDQVDRSNSILLSGKDNTEPRGSSVQWKESQPFWRASFPLLPTLLLALQLHRLFLLPLGLQTKPQSFLLFLKNLLIASIRYV